MAKVHLMIPQYNFRYAYVLVSTFGTLPNRIARDVCREGTAPALSLAPQNTSPHHRIYVAWGNTALSCVALS